MNVTSLNSQTTRLAAMEALQTYKLHRSMYDDRDWEIERIYRAIAKGKTIISVNDAIVHGGLDEQHRPKLAIMRADQEAAYCNTYSSDRVSFSNGRWGSRASDRFFEIPWTGRPVNQKSDHKALLPRIPPQHRPVQKDLSKYHLLWEASWTSVPRDPYLLKRIGKDAWIVLAAWDLTEVELSVMRARQLQ